jgi:Tfp pilus assembly protein PilF
VKGNLKARFRRGLACLELGDADQAKDDLAAVAAADPANALAARGLRKVDKK